MFWPALPLIGGTDLVRAVRGLKRTKSVSSSAIFSIALGFAAATLGVSGVLKSLWPDLPYQDAESLYEIREGTPDLIALRTIYAWKDAIGLLPRSAYYREGLTGRSESTGEVVSCAAVDRDFFALLGVPPLRGRFLAASDDEPGAAPVVVLSAWTRQGSSSNTLGSQVMIQGRAYEVVGVAPRSLAYPADTRCWIANASGALPEASAKVYTVVARLAVPSGVDALRTRLAGTAAQAGDSTFIRHSLAVTPLKSGVVAATSSAVLGVAIAACLACFAACVNFTILCLGQWHAQSHERAVLVALGAGASRRTLSDLLPGGLLLLVGAGMATLLNAGAGRVLSTVALTGATAFAAPLDRRALLVPAVVMLVLVGVLVLLRPRADEELASSLGSRGVSGGPRRTRIIKALVVCEISLAFFLIVCGGLVASSWRFTQSVDLGYRPDGLAMSVVEFPRGGSESGQRGQDLAEAIVARLARVPYAGGVAAWGTSYPAAGRRRGDAITLDAGQPARAGVPTTSFQVSPQFFEVFGIPVVRGRAFAQEEAASENVVILNETAASRLWPGEDALGRLLRLGGANEGGAWMTVVGVVKNTQPMHPYGRLLAARAGEKLPEVPLMFRPMRASELLTSDFEKTPGLTIVVRSAEPAVTVAAMRSAILGVGGGVSVREVGEWSEFLNRGSGLEQLEDLLAVLMFAAGVALATALLGVFGVSTMAVEQRTRELAIRTALGSPPGALVRLVLKDACVLGVIGIAAGALISSWLLLLIKGPLFGVTPNDPTGRLYGTNLINAEVLLLAGIALGLAICVAALRPALGVRKTNPLQLLNTQ